MEAMRISPDRCGCVDNAAFASKRERKEFEPNFAPLELNEQNATAAI
jgi:hypothetical protein